MPQSTFKRTYDEVITDLGAYLDTFTEADREYLLLAVTLAIVAHEGQVRKADPNSGVPVQKYAIHPMRVMLILALEFGVKDKALLAAALLHDAIEDGKGRITLDQIERRFGKQARTLVEYVTKPKGEMTEEQHEAYYRQIATVYEARLLKLADRIDNLRDALTLSDTKFMKKQLLETKQYFFSGMTSGPTRYPHDELVNLLDQLEARVQ